MYKDYFILPWREMKRRKLRSWLTLIGIIIGIAAIISLISLGEGLQNALSKQFAMLGEDKLLITAKGNILTAGLSIDAIKITEKDQEVIQKTPGIKKTAGMIYSTGRIEFNDHVRYFFIEGMPTDPEERALVGETNFFHLLRGRPLQNNDNYKAVLGYEYTKETMFEKEISLGDKIKINNKDFKVVGFWERTGSPQDDSAIMIPLETYQDLFNKPKELGMIFAQTAPGEDPLKVAEKVEKTLRKSRKVKEGKEDFTIQTPNQLAQTFETIITMVEAVLIGIASISLLVGGIGIMNTMYTAVLQRTKEIGILKAIGAKKVHILTLFLIESGLYGLGGGIIGIIIGIGFAKLVEFIFSLMVGPSFLAVELNWWLVGGTLLFSFLVGCLSGVAPARRASKLNPVDALRGE